MPKKSKKAKKSLSMERKNGYFCVSPAEKVKINEYAEEYMKFLDNSKTERMAHDESVRFLKTAGFKEISSYKNKKLKPGDKIYISCAGKTLLAVVMGKKPLENGMHIVGAHTDAPRIDIKQNPLYENGEIAFLDTHYYGGIKKYQWVARPLALCGVVVKKNGEKINIDIGNGGKDPIFCITDLLPHLAQSQMTKNASKIIEGENLDIVFGSIPSSKKQKESIKSNILQLLNERYGIKEEDFLSAELEMVPAEKARHAGIDSSMILAYGQDDRICAFAGLKAMLSLNPIPEYSACLLLCDKEEIGSVGATGMASNFFENTISEIINLSGSSYNELLLKRTLKNSWMLSADVNALFDPLYANVSDKKNTPLINGGICVTKFTGSRGKSHANDANAEFMAHIRRIFDSAKVIWQTGELGKVDEGGGGTIAYLMARYGMEVIDSGPGILSMHAPCELSGKLDAYMSYKAYLAFYRDKRV